MPSAVLEVDRLTRRFGEVVACRDVCFSVAPGELFGLVGSNGAGKTTVLRILLGALTPDSGQVRVGGEPVTPAHRRRFGYLAERHGLYPRMRVLDQLVYLAELHGLDADAAHRAAEYWLARLGLRDRRGEVVRRLDLRTRQRVRLAAALVHDPDVLVLDEPFSGLDAAAVGALGALLRERAAAGAPVVFTTEALDLAEQLCDSIAILHSGHVVAAGTVSQLGADGGHEILVHAPEAPPDWADGLPDVAVQSIHNGHTRLRLGDHADDQAVLAAALATGPVHEFTRVRPTLAELYRDVVSR